MQFIRSWTKNILLLLVYLFAGGALVLTIDGLMSGPDLVPFNNAVEDVVLHMRTPFLTTLMLFITNVASPLVLSILSVFIAIYLLLKKDTYDALLYITSIALAVVSLVVLKNTFQIARPDYGVAGLTTWSFPSGHATIATAFFFATAYTFLGKIRNPLGRLLLVLAAVAGVGLVGFSRLYLGAHWALDILGGVALGLVTVSMVALIFNIFLEERKWKERRVRDSI